ncbi:MAG: DUF4878 domain-containing protein [Bacteroidales bacterium]|nr:DUF4878 domain-containing protein [Bacteroidales bacterium]
MKAKHIIIIAAMAALIGLATACQSNPNSPLALAKQAMTALQKGDYDAFIDTFNFTDAEKSAFSGLIKAVGVDLIENGEGIESFKFTDTEIGSEKASITVHIKYNNGSEGDEILKFVKKDGAWYQEWGQ